MAPTKKSRKSRKSKKPRSSICQRVRTKKPCLRITACKVASGSVRTFCRKKKNTRKNKA